VDNLQIDWIANGHIVLQQDFDLNATEQAFARSIRYDSFRSEGLYDVSVRLGDTQTNYSFAAGLQFVPSVCKWFDVVD
jgi:hypothetical protein